MAKNGLLTETQRDRIAGEKKRDDAERNLRKRVRERIYNAIVLDSAVLFEDLRSSDRKKIFQAETVDVYKYAEMGGEEGWNQLGDEFQAVNHGITNLLAFLYMGIAERQGNVGSIGFEELLWHAMNDVADKKGWVLDEFECTLKFDRNPGFKEMYEQFQNDELPVEDADSLLRHDKITREEYADYVLRNTPS